MPRKRIQIDWSRLEGMVMFDASLATCALELGCSEDTIQRAVKREYNQTFEEYKKHRLGKTILRLKQKMIKKGLDGNVTCMIFALKNISDWSDKIEQTNVNKDPVKIEIVRDDK